MSTKVITALLIEDNPADVQSIESTLAAAGELPLRLECRSCLSTGLARLREGGIDVILLDLSLPDAQGLQSLRQAQAETHAPAPPIVVLTGIEEEQTAIEAIRAGAQSYLIKGKVTADLLAHSLSDAIERKRAEEAQRQSEERFRRYFELGLVGMAITSPAKGIIEGNDKLCDILGYTRSELIQKSWTEITHPEDLHLDVAQFNRVMVGEINGYSIDKRFIRKDGQVLYATIAVECLRRTDGSVDYFVALMQDITERKRAELERQKFVSLADHSTEFIGMCDMNFMPFYINRAGLDLVGLESLEQTRRTPVPEFFFPEDRRFITEEFFPRVLREGRAAVEIRFRHFKTGEPIWMLYNVFYIRDSAGKPSGLATVSVDITERKRSEQALQEAEARLRLALEAGGIGTWDWNMATGQIIWSRGHEALWGMPPGAFKGTYEEFDARLYSEDRQGLNRAVAEAIAERRTFHHEFRIVWPDGTLHWVAGQGDFFFNDAGQPLRMIGIVKEITERKQAEEALRIRARRQAILAELGQQALSGVSPLTLMERTVDRVAETLAVEYCHVLEPLPDGSALLLRAGAGWKEEWVGRTTVEMSKGSQAAYVFISNGPVVVENLRTETRFTAPPFLLAHGVVSGVSVLIPGQDYPYGLLEAHTGRRRAFTEEEVHFLQAVATILAMAIDRKKVEERIEHQAYHDALTGLPNRLLLEDRLSVAVAHAHRSGEILAILLIDLDRFKVINDTLGHPAGDALLRAVGARFVRAVREGDTVARMGGDEFAVLLSELNSDEVALEIADRITSSLREPFQLDGRDLFVTASIGVAVYPHAGVDGRTLLQHADIALYRAKEHGRNTLRAFSPAMNSRAFERLSLESSLRQALERREFLLHFQPQVDLNGGEIIGFEALIRWHRPEIGMVSPAEFIPLAEETGLILPIGEWVLRAACAQNVAWQRAGFPAMRIAVNLSARQFHRDDLVDTVTRALRETGLSPQYLELELTESILMGKEAGILHMLRVLTDMGIQLSIDDFGTGYSSLAYLKRFPISKLKVDQIFVRNLTTDPNDAVITRTVVGMAHSLRLKALAEGVETEAQLACLRSLGCDEMQGYLFSRPLPADEATTLLAQKKRL